MIQTRLKIDGMACAMCEAHVCETIRKAVPGAQKVSASHSKGTAEFLSESPVEETALRAVLDPTGYRLLEMTSAPYEKKAFSLFGKKK